MILSRMSYGEMNSFHEIYTLNVTYCYGVKNLFSKIGTLFIGKCGSLHEGPVCVSESVVVCLSCQFWINFFGILSC